MKQIIHFLIGAMVIFVLAVVVSLVMPVTYKSAEGKITMVYKGGVGDAVFELAGNSQSFYLNRAYQGYGKSKVESLVGQNVRIVFAEQWTPLDPFGKASKNIVELSAGDAVYSQH